IIHASENRETAAITWKQLYQETAALQHTMEKIGVQKGDRVVAYVANTYETIVAFLATASLGAIWSSASPDFGTQSVIDRFKQIEAKVMITVDSYCYVAKSFYRTTVIENIQSELPTLKATIAIPYLPNNPDFSKIKNVILCKDASKTNEQRTLRYEY